MRHFRIVLILSLASTLFACDTCGNADALVSKYDFEFTVVDAETGDNLISGDAPALDPYGFELYSLRGSERFSHELYIYPNESYSGNQVIYADIRGLKGHLYLAYPDGNVDTLQAFFSQHNSECWGRIDTLEELVRNGSETFSDLYTVIKFEY
ncbi:hypothetical protein GCM10009119_17280 [Algoriphagus jejuensis]|uniref:Lipoprotein n=1 Tax=Algoriphagus jejuensis TaxID=419934 RepID=A0ABP3YDC9_9BACT